MILSSTNDSGTGVDRDLDGWFTPGRFAGILAVFIFAAYPDVVLGLKTFFFRDFGIYGYPLAFYHRESFWRGEMPLWNPLNNCGLPFLAQWNTLVLYPGSLFYLLTPLSWSLGMFCLGHLFIAGLGMYWLARRWVGNRLAAAVAGLAFALSGLALNSLMWPALIATLSWMPWVVLFVERAWIEGGKMIAAGAVVGALQMLTGTPEIILFTWFVLGLMVAIQLIEGRPSRSVLLGRFTIVVLLVTGLAAAQLFPFLDLMRHSQRELDVADTDWSMPATGWANLLVPLFRCYQSFHDVFFQLDQYWTSSYYLGVAILALAILAVGQAHKPRVWLLAATAAFGLILALGDEGYLYGGLRKAIPQLNYMRFPIKFVVLTAFCLPLLAAFGVRYFQNMSSVEVALSGKKVIALWAVLAGLSSWIVWFDYHYPLSDAYRKFWPATWQSAVSRAAFLTLILGALYSLRLVGRGPRQLLLRFVLLLLIASDLLTHTTRQNPTIPRGAFDPGLVRLSPQPRHGEARAMISRTANNKLFFTATKDALNDYICKRLGLFLNCNLLDGVPKVNGFYPLYLRIERDIWSLLYESTNQPPSGLLDFLGVAQITAPGKYFDWERRLSNLPLATAGQKPVFADDATILRSLAGTAYNPHEIVYLPLEVKPFVHVTNQTHAKIVTTRFSAHHAEIETLAEQSSLLVVAQTYHYSWRAYVEGRPTPVFRANRAFQAIEIPAGRHHIRLRYEDRLFYFGAAISGLTLAGCLVIWFRCRRTSSLNVARQTN